MLIKIIEPADRVTISPLEARARLGDVQAQEELERQAMQVACKGVRFAKDEHLRIDQMLKEMRVC